MTDLSIYKVRVIVIFIAVFGIVYWMSGMGSIQQSSCAELDLGEGVVLHVPEQASGNCNADSAFQNVNASESIEVCRELNDQSTLPLHMPRERFNKLQQNCVTISQDLDFGDPGD